MFSLKKSRFPLLCHFGQLAILAALAAAPRVPPLANEVFFKIVLVRLTLRMTIILALVTIQN